MCAATVVAVVRVHMRIPHSAQMWEPTQGPASPLTPIFINSVSLLRGGSVGTWERAPHHHHHPSSSLLLYLAPVSQPPLWMKLKEKFIKGKGAVSCRALLINIPLQVQRLHYTGVTPAQKGRHIHTHTRKHTHARHSSSVYREITIWCGEGWGERPRQRVRGTLVPLSDSLSV